ncbi:MAG: ATP-dependent helicase HrpB, partial [Actinomycetota bacterium]|nr:ATP-dependent helicase HrpB [Actinomycetota bacterium]
LARIDAGQALRAFAAARVGADVGRLDELAPERLPVPSGSRIALDYSGDAPALPVPVQEVFGWTASPAVAGGRVPVVLHLLSPAGRPAAVTADLESFWDNGYPQVRAELRGRYPKHAWPEDPRSATPARGTGRRRR